MARRRRGGVPRPRMVFAEAKAHGAPVIARHLHVDRYLSMIDEMLRSKPSRADR